MKKKVIFMGTSEFAVPILNALLESDHIISAVFSQSLKPQGRHLIPQKSPIHVLAEEHLIPVHTNTTLKSEEAFNTIDAINADVIIVVSYGLIIPDNIIQNKKYCINVHPSALPKYRGASPIQSTILNGDTETEVCIINVTKEIDAGDILISKKCTIAKNTTTTDLTYTLANIAAKLMLELLVKIDTVQPIPQSLEGVTHTPKILKSDGMLDFNDSAHILERKIRAFVVWPKTYFIYQGERIFILKAHVEEFVTDSYSNIKPGTVLQCDDTLKIACKNGMLVCTVLQRAGKKMMDTANFLRGYSMHKGDCVRYEQDT